MTGRFVSAVAGLEQQIPPVWCMRQAGRYQRSYQALRQRHSFEALCREPDLAMQVAVNAVNEFDFDAGILFSDLLFPLNALGLPLHYDDRGPHLGTRLDAARLAQLRPLDAAMDALSFQSAAVTATRAALPASKGLIGFIGGPWTLFVYAVEGTHAGALARAKTSLPLYRAFADLVVPLLQRMATAQLGAGADVVMVFDTAAGELTPAAFARHIVPDLRRLSQALPRRLGYYARGLHPAHLAASGLASHGADAGTRASSLGDWAGVGLDWRWDLGRYLSSPDRDGFVQGNLDPALLHLTGDRLRDALHEFLAPLAALRPADRRGWVCGLGHGVLPATPEDSVATFVRTVRERLA